MLELLLSSVGKNHLSSLRFLVPFSTSTEQSVTAKRVGFNYLTASEILGGETLHAFWKDCIVVVVVVGFAEMSAYATLLSLEGSPVVQIGDVMCKMQRQQPQHRTSFRARFTVEINLFRTGYLVIGKPEKKIKSRNCLRRRLYVSDAPVRGEYG